MSEVRLPEGLDEFLNAVGWSSAKVEPLAGDASFRRYFRVRKSGGQTAMLMDAPPPHEDPKPFLHVAKYLLDHGFRAPAIYGEDLTRGMILIEDFGDERMREHLDARPEDEAAIYRQAIDTLVDLEKAPVADVAPYDAAAYLRETALLADWYMPAMGLAVDKTEFDAFWSRALAPLFAEKWQQVTVLRDYHAENIMLLSDHTQGLIDFQDALAGHPAYDLVSLLQDARRDVSPELEADMLAYYRDHANPDADFNLHYALLGAQRNTKIIGIFTRLWKRDGKERYLGFLPRMWALLERDLAHPGLTELRNWFDQNIPQEIRAKSPLDLAA
ncbi:phosphotransferase [Sphingorhabdus sp.]|uniref:aminoglycoside phosphotransferase family protein n=1 Tax=Sphingorhabdus sp. TaxID=1902408 RepID=UPI002C4049EA|nr:phosphotransferase [Sphingorhabdus sp.]HMT42097.1 phosphotransferase [Sphingorhabdus sp.]